MGPPWESWRVSMAATAIVSRDNVTDGVKWTASPGGGRPRQRDNVPAMACAFCDRVESRDTLAENELRRRPP